MPNDHAVPDLQAELRRANERAQDFMSILAHDLKNPLTTAMGMAETLVRIDDLDRATAAQLRDSLTGSLRRAIRLVDRLYEHAQAGSRPVDPESVTTLDECPLGVPQ